MLQDKRAPQAKNGAKPPLHFLCRSVLELGRHFSREIYGFPFNALTYLKAYERYHARTRRRDQLADTGVGVLYERPARPGCFRP